MFSLNLQYIVFGKQGKAQVLYIELRFVMPFCFTGKGNDNRHIFDLFLFTPERKKQKFAPFCHQKPKHFYGFSAPFFVKNFSLINNLFKILKKGIDLPTIIWYKYIVFVRACVDYCAQKHENCV